MQGATAMMGSASCIMYMRNASSPFPSQEALLVGSCRPPLKPHVFTLSDKLEASEQRLVICLEACGLAPRDCA